MQIILANPRGFCAGVNRAINIVKKALKIYGKPIYVYHEIVHNSYVLKELSYSGAIFIEKIHEVPKGSILIFSAHGVSKKIRSQAKDRNLIIFDATCPLVTKIHAEVARASHQGAEIILIGHMNHPEVNGILGQYNNINGGIYLIQSSKDIDKLKVRNENNLFYAMQTTLSVEDSKIIVNMLRQRFPYIIGPYKDDICYATTNRQKSVRTLAIHTDIVLVIGTKNSSNSNRLVEVSRKIGTVSYLINNAKDIKQKWIQGVKNIGIINSASAPDILVNEVIDYLYTQGVVKVEELSGDKEKIVFKLPKELR